MLLGQIVLQSKLHALTLSVPSIVKQKLLTSLSRNVLYSYRRLDDSKEVLQSSRLPNRESPMTADGLRAYANEQVMLAQSAAGGTRRPQTQSRQNDHRVSGNTSRIEDMEVRPLDNLQQQARYVLRHKRARVRLSSLWRN